MPVLMGDATIMADLGISSANHWNLVTTEGSEIVFKSKYKDTETKAAIEALLTAP